MKFLSGLALAMLMAVPSLAAIYPAATNAPNTFFFQSTFRAPSVSLSPTTNSPTDDEYATAGWARRSLSITNMLNNTNAQLQTINFKNVAYNEGDFQTNAAFAWLGFTGISSTQYQTAVVWLTNNSGSLFAFTAPANCHTLGTLNVTNLTECVFKCSAGRWTNLLALPLW
jgi:hypothetical protein